MISVNFWCNKEHIYSWYPDFIPNFKEDELIYLEISLTPIGKDKWKKVQTMRLTPFVIIEINHSLKKEYSSNITDSYGLEIKLKKI